MINLTITTAIETVTFFSFESFVNWDANENQYQINAYILIDENGNEYGNKGINAAAFLYEIMEGLGVAA